jgi:hypothetical protein
MVRRVKNPYISRLGSQSHNPLVLGSNPSRTISLAHCLLVAALRLSLLPSLSDSLLEKEVPMRTLALLFLGVVVDWAASGVDWSREAVGEDEIVRGERTVGTILPSLPANRAQLVDAARASSPLTATTQAKLADAEPSPQWNSVPNNGPRRVWETRMEVDANGEQRPVTVSRLVNADGSIAQETPQGLVGRFQATAYGSPSGHGCYVVDTMTGKTWHAANGQPARVVTEALIQAAGPPTMPVPTPAYFDAPPLTSRPVPELAQPSPEQDVAPTPAPQSPEPDDAN